MESRVIKFRAWNVATKKMIDLKKITPLALNMDTDGLFLPFSDGLPLMQFTGLQDKHGKDIYEGDVCSGHSDGNGKIVWTNYDGGYDYEFDDGNIVGINEVLKEIQVIGNIYETPELLT